MPASSLRLSGLEVVLHPDREALQLASGKAVGGGGGVVAVGRDAVPARAEAVVRPAVWNAPCARLLGAHAYHCPISGASLDCMLIVRGDHIGRASHVNAADPERVAVGAIGAPVSGVRAIAAGAVRFAAGGGRVV